jgi:ABC-2 type transport system permease protein
MRALQPALTFTESLASYGSFFIRCLKGSFAYRATTITNLLTTATAYSITIMIWRQVYTQNSALTIPKQQMFVYLLLAGCINYALGMSIEFRIGNRIRTGQIATDLLKPVDFQISQGIQSISDGFFNGAMGIIVFLCGFSVFGTQVFPASASALGLAVVSFLLSFMIMYGIGFLFVQGAFYTYSGYGIFASRNALQLTFSGVSAPLDYYPPLLRTITEWLPFRHTIYTPISIYLGWAKDNDAYSLLLQQTAWVLGLFMVGRLIMKQAIKQLEVQGG